MAHVSQPEGVTIDPDQEVIWTIDGVEVWKAKAGVGGLELITAFKQPGTFVVTVSCQGDTCSGSDNVVIEVKRCCKAGAINVCGDNLDVQTAATKTTGPVISVSGNVTVGFDSGEQFLRLGDNPVLCDGEKKEVEGTAVEMAIDTSFLTFKWPNYTIFTGDPAMPLDPGSGGGLGTSNVEIGGNGGGVVRIQALVMVIDGAIIAAGGPALNAGSSDGGAGAGGSIWLSATTLSGVGTLDASGGSSMGGGGGGGGRISIEATETTGWAPTVVTVDGLQSGAMTLGDIALLEPPGSTGHVGLARTSVGSGIGSSAGASESKLAA